MSDWRDARIEEVRRLTADALPGVTETRKWRKPSNPDGVPVWEQDGILFTGERYKDKVKLTLGRGAALADPDGLFNGNDTGGTRRSIDLREGDALPAAAFTVLVQAATAVNAKG